MAAPPSYSEARVTTSLSPNRATSGPASPDYSDPHTFSIGPRQTTALVTTDQLKAHLLLLRIFYRLRVKAEGLELPQVPLRPEESLKERRWSFFVSYAVERFQAWCCSSYLSSVSEYDLLLPPMDVLMVWHAYRLNPAWYAEDSARLVGVSRLESRAGSMFPCLLTPGRRADVALQRFQEHIVEDLGYDRRDEPPSEDRVSQWASLTDMPFDPFEDIMEWTTREVSCVHCRGPIPAKLVTNDGTGYLQSSFKVRCSGCENETTRSALGVAKFARNFALSGDTNASFLAGTLHTATNPVDTNKANAIKQSIGESRLFSRPRNSNTLQWETNIGEGCKWDLSVLFLTAGHRMEFNGGTTLARMKAAYTDDRPFSVELVGAVLRQASFIEKMHKLRWTEPDCFKSAEDEIVLLHAVTRYHTFLDLTSSRPANLLVPTLDIDLAWHTHQLLAAQYGSDTRKYVGRFVDHDDKVEDKALANCFNLTCKEWEKRFNVQYCTCGCYTPERTISGKMTQRVSQVFGRRKSIPNEHLLPFAQRGHSTASHPSDHNSVVPPNPPTKRAQEDAKLNATFDPFWGKPFVHPISGPYEPAGCVAAARMAHAGCGVGIDLNRASPGFQDGYMKDFPKSNFLFTYETSV